jgi:ATP-dependent protease ClpP protease subunit
MKEILIYGDIGPFGSVSPQRVAQELKAANGEPVNLRIFSDGGDVLSGFAIYNYLQSTPNVTASIDGFAGSISTILMLGAGRVTMPSNGFLMTHNPVAIMRGQAVDLRDGADLLDRVADKMAGIYTAETGQEESTVRAWMGPQDLWHDAEQALAAGLIDEITAPVAFEAKAKIDLGRYSRTPAALLNLLSPAQPKKKRIQTMTQLLAALRELKVLDANESEVDETVLANQVRARIGAVLEQNATLTNQLVTGLEARAKTAVEAAVAEGRVAKAVQDQFVAAYIRDEPGTVAILASLTKPQGAGTSPVGFGGASSDKSLSESIAAEADPRKRVKLMAKNWDALSRG